MAAGFFSQHNLSLLNNTFSQSKFGETGAGVALGSNPISFQYQIQTLTFYTCGIGSNALHALQELGLLEAIMGKVTPERRLYVFLSGTGDHELVYDVSYHKSHYQ